MLVKQIRKLTQRVFITGLVPDRARIQFHILLIQKELEFGKMLI